MLLCLKFSNRDHHLLNSNKKIRLPLKHHTISTTLFYSLKKASLHNFNWAEIFHLDHVKSSISPVSTSPRAEIADMVHCDFSDIFFNLAQQILIRCLLCKNSILISKNLLGEISDIDISLFKVNVPMGETNT